MRYKNTDALPIKEERDLVEVVRCKDCKHYKPQTKSAQWNSTTNYCCRSATVKTNPNDFCSYGVTAAGVSTCSPTARTSEGGKQ